MSAFRLSGRKSRRSGLTVLELVSALSLFVIILGMLMIAVNGATDIWSHSASKSAGQTHARRALELMADDLACAIGQRPSDANEKPWFIIDYPSQTNQCGLYFVKTLSPKEVQGENMRSLELVAYLLTTETNVLSRYTAPVSLQTDVSLQLDTFFQQCRNTAPPTNVLSVLVTAFGVTACTNAPPATLFREPEFYDNAPGRRVNLCSLPDFVDIGIAYTNRDDSSKSYTHTSYLSKRITFPAAPASRLP